MKKTLLEMGTWVAVVIGSVGLGGSTFAGSLPMAVTDLDYYDNGQPAPEKVE
ncbi:hypothetical protein N8737_04950 [Verrucomicrobia bacterium]|nr:hypothetical protein [Verrucomicrobiota bacterium]